MGFGFVLPLVGLEICFLSQTWEVLALGCGPTCLFGRLTTTVPGSLWPWRVRGAGVSCVSVKCQFEQRPAKASLGVTLSGFLRALRSDFNLTAGRAAAFVEGARRGSVSANGRRKQVASPVMGIKP